MKKRQSLLKSRASGILLPVGSLPSPYGIGTFGKAAYAFGDFLKAAGQKFWQVLPLGPTSYGDSPYQSFSAFAGNPFFIDPEKLMDEGLLTREEADAFDFGDNPRYVQYEKVYLSRFKLLRLAFNRSGCEKDSEFARFIKENEDWLPDYALYMALKDRFSGKSWLEWPDPLRLREEKALKEAKDELKEEVAFWEYCQYLFFKQWGELKAYLNGIGVYVIGDIPIYTALDSTDVWASPDLFCLDEDRRPTEVAGCPPDAFSETGQLWGNPLYRWDVMEEDGFDWWIRRLRATLKLYDIIRIDHFRGLEQYWAIPYGDETAQFGCWKPGPGKAFFKAIREKLGKVDLILEDLGFLTPAVHALRKFAGYPGMKVLEFAFDPSGESDYLPHNYEKETVVYTGTHDNDTVLGFLKTNRKEAAFARKYLGFKNIKDGAFAFIKAAWASVANLSLAQMQDFLNLGSEARINTPSTLGQNWMWRMDEDALTPALAQKIYGLTKLYGRLPKA